MLVYYIVMKTETQIRLSETPAVTGQGFVAHLIAVTHYVQKTTQEKLVASQRYEKLSLMYEGYISQLAERDCSPGELAAKQGISKQACSKVIRELEKLDLIARRKHPEDSRSSVLSLSEKGLQLLKDAAAYTVEVQEQFSGSVGIERMQQMIGHMETLCRIRGIGVPRFQALESVEGLMLSDRPTRLNLLSAKLNRDFRQSLFMSLSGKGFQGLKSNYGQVLGMIGSEGVRIQYLASVIGVSKQAIAVTATELEQQGYITREQDPLDKRQVILRTTPLGARLLVEALASVRELEKSIREAIGVDAYRNLEETLATLFAEVSQHYGATPGLSHRIQQLSEDLLAELGVAGAQALAQHLITVTRGKA
jgi:DNA-binding MarR family transcriptional regulator